MRLNWVHLKPGKSISTRFQVLVPNINIIVFYCETPFIRIKKDSDVHCLSPF
jgi:hypothetical protein